MSNPDTATVINNRLLDRLAIVVGIFGSRGWGELAVVTEDGTTQHRPVTPDTNDKIQYARKVLAEFGRKPVTT